VIRGWRVCGVAALVLLLAGGCAVRPANSITQFKYPAAQRDMLADAAKAVETAPWPKPEPASILVRMTGVGGNDRVSRDDAVAAYLLELEASGAGFVRLSQDARLNLAAAERLDQTAREALRAPRHSMNDIALIETAIQTLREHRHIYADAGKELKKRGFDVSDDALDALRDDFRLAVKTLGKTADVLADQIDEDRSATYASPDRTIR
jgi:hypothetical protein